MRGFSLICSVLSRSLTHARRTSEYQINVLRFHSDLPPPSLSGRLGPYTWYKDLVAQGKLQHDPHQEKVALELDNLLGRLEQYENDMEEYHLNLSKWEETRENERRRLLTEEAEGKQKGGVFSSVNKHRSRFVERWMSRTKPENVEPGVGKWVSYLNRERKLDSLIGRRPTAPPAPKGLYLYGNVGSVPLKELLSIEEGFTFMRIDPGGGPSFRGVSNSEVIGSGSCDEGGIHVISASVSDPRDDRCGQTFPATPDVSEDVSVLLEDREARSREERDWALVEGVFGGGGLVAWVGGLGEGEGAGCKGFFPEVEEVSGSSRGLELVPYCGVNADDLFNHLGWVQDLVDDRLVTNELFNLLVAREVDGRWVEEDKLVSGMSQVEVSKWVLKRINGFNKFLDLLMGLKIERCSCFRKLKKSGGRERRRKLRKGGINRVKG
ncbi:hypothetical protein RHGRI_020977 [Rhododendron griersonianum]|uniref:Uncharacterized protein n=1 Tax=Rhododendron griersonianum TaxID=479676 RepID=A0AAV6JIL1_9ERIC|nr:hypothetical protein RHGRI_020977 [Rhododendron griersonianum]